MGSIAPVRFQRTNVEQEDELAVRNHCKDPPTLCGRWPLSLDLLMQLFEADRANQILRFMTGMLQKAGTTHAQVLLGSRAINTVDPENLEAILGTQFKSRQEPQPYLMS